MNKVIWGCRDLTQVEKYNQICNDELCDIDLPPEMIECAAVSLDRMINLELWMYLLIRTELPLRLDRYDTRLCV
ncbi:unnamed protein product [Leptidea sinapis]|uniref:Uncharacterized protein n=1 Tax=Leptidea sinapis TaxID=189913 RepID=A0A5E4Q9G7_9NEOP|nr:unnamed protein product [Leptidea sinapis]